MMKRKNQQHQQNSSLIPTQPYHFRATDWIQKPFVSSMSFVASLIGEMGQHNHRDCPVDEGCWDYTLFQDKKKTA